MDRTEKRIEIERLASRIREIESELAVDEAAENRRSRQYYLAYYATTGFLLGIFGACTSLLLNIVGSLIWPSLVNVPKQDPLRLIQVYLTFPLGESALRIDNGIVLAIGVCLYVGTGMIYGLLFQVMLSRYYPSATLAGRVVICSLLAIVVWLVNFYGILSWLQPLVCGGRWILDLVPWWVAAMTHLVFGWTMALLYPLGVYHPYRAKLEL